MNTVHCEARKGNKVAAKAVKDTTTTVAKNENSAQSPKSEVPEGFKPLVDRMLERDKELSRVLEMPDPTSVEEIQESWGKLPDDRCTFDRGFGEALWATKDEVVWKLENAFRQWLRGNWGPYLAVTKDPDALEILNVLDDLEVISQKMAEMNEKAKPIAMKVAEDFFKNPSKFPAARVEDARWFLLGFSPVAACLPNVLCGRLAAPLFKRKVREQSADEKKLAKLVFELEKLNFEYGRLYAFKLHEVENRYLDHHPEDEVED